MTHPLATPRDTEADATREMQHLAHITGETCYLVLDGIQYHYANKTDMDTWYPEGWPQLITNSDLLRDTAVVSADIAADAAERESPEAPLLTQPSDTCLSCGDVSPMLLCPACEETGEALSSPPVAAGDILAMYREAYGWSKAELDDLVTLEQLTAEHAQIEIVL